MIYINEQSISERYFGKTPILETYRGKVLIWQAIRSCFGNGYWENDFPWDNSEGWEN